MTASPQNIDSLKREHQNRVAAVQAFIELKYYKRIDSLNTTLISIKTLENQQLRHSIEYYKKAYNQCDGTTVPLLNSKIAIKDEEIVDLKLKNKKEKAKKIGLGIGLPLVGTACFIGGFYLSKLLR